MTGGLQDQVRSGEDEFGVAIYPTLKLSSALNKFPSVKTVLTKVSFCLLCQSSTDVPQKTVLIWA